MNRFINFLGNMHSGSDDVSSKRVYATMLVLLIICMVVGAQFFRRPLDFEVLITLIITVGTLCGMNLKAQLTSLSAKKDVASDIVTATQDTETAKDVLQADKPNG